MTIPLESQRVLFNTCQAQQLRAGDFDDQVWAWIWNPKVATSEGRLMQQQMVEGVTHSNRIDRPRIHALSSLVFDCICFVCPAVRCSVERG